MNRPTEPVMITLATIADMLQIGVKHAGALAALGHFGPPVYPFEVLPGKRKGVRRDPR